MKIAMVSTHFVSAVIAIFFLHEVYKQMENHAGQNGAVTDQIHPCDDISHKYGAHKEIDNIQRTNHKPCLICPP